jgi:hypothetical protein
LPGLEHKENTLSDPTTDIPREFTVARAVRLAQ